MINDYSGQMQQQNQQQQYQHPGSQFTVTHHPSTADSMQATLSSRIESTLLATDTLIYRLILKQRRRLLIYSHSYNMSIIIQQLDAGRAVLAPSLCRLPKSQANCDFCRHFLLMLNFYVYNVLQGIWN